MENNKCTYQWHLLPGEDQPGWSLPRYGTAEDYLDLPMIFQINDEQLNNFRGQREIALLNTLMEFGKSMTSFRGAPRTLLKRGLETQSKKFC